MPARQPSTASRYYAGIGSRQTPQSSRGLIHDIAQALERMDYTLRSGGAPGADTFFEEAVSRSQIFLPWRGFNDRPDSGFISPSQDAIALASEAIGGFSDRPQPVRMLLASNMHQVLGPDLDSPVDFVVCWTPKGRIVGGTAHAIRLAHSRDIPIYNLAVPKNRDALLERAGLAKQLDLF